MLQRSLKDDQLLLSLDQLVLSFLQVCQELDVGIDKNTVLLRDLLGITMTDVVCKRQLVKKVCNRLKRLTRADWLFHFLSCDDGSSDSREDPHSFRSPSSKDMDCRTWMLRINHGLAVE